MNHLIFRLLSEIARLNVSQQWSRLWWSLTMKINDPQGPYFGQYSIFSSCYIPLPLGQCFSRGPFSHPFHRYISVFGFSHLDLVRSGGKSSFFFFVLSHIFLESLEHVHKMLQTAVTHSPFWPNVGFFPSCLCGFSLGTLWCTHHARSPGWRL